MVYWVTDRPVNTTGVFKKNLWRTNLEIKKLKNYQNPAWSQRVL